jgi:hypothetical protein
MPSLKSFATRRKPAKLFALLGFISLRSDS